MADAVRLDVSRQAALQLTREETLLAGRSSLPVLVALKRPEDENALGGWRWTNLFQCDLVVVRAQLPGDLPAFALVGPRAREARMLIEDEDIIEFARPVLEAALGVRSDPRPTAEEPTVVPRLLTDDERQASAEARLGVWFGFALGLGVEAVYPLPWWLALALMIGWLGVIVALGVRDALDG